MDKQNITIVNQVPMSGSGMAIIPMDEYNRLKENEQQLVKMYQSFTLNVCSYDEKRLNLTISAELLEGIAKGSMAAHREFAKFVPVGLYEVDVTVARLPNDAE